MVYTAFHQQLQHWCDQKSIALPTVVVASKYGDIPALRALSSQGATIFGENRIQDAVKKIQALPDPAVSWHFIGHLQRNKAKQAVANFACIQSGSSLPLLQEIDRQAGACQKKQAVMIQINPAKDTNKHGFFLEDVYTHQDLLFSFPNLEIMGIMAMVPYERDLSLVRPYFQQAAILFSKLRMTHVGLRVLSMGMSHDYQIALEEGATMIRIGSLLF